MALSIPSPCNSRCDAVEYGQPPTESTISDNKNDTGQLDRNLISFMEKYELYYAANQLRKQVPGATKPEARAALTEAAKKVAPDRGREPIMRAARKILND
jgi:hypothetical protein